MADLKQELLLALPRLRKAVFSQPTEQAGYEKVILRPVSAKGKVLFQAECFRNNQAFHRNCEEETLAQLMQDEFDGRFRQVLITTSDGAAQYVLKRDGSYKRTGKSAVPLPGGDAVQEHDRKKNYLLPEGENIPALVDLGVFTPDFHIVKSRYDKYKQIDRFVRLVDDELSATDRKSITVLDFGCGKSYLTFILYYYFAVKRGMKTTIYGYDLKQEVVEHCNQIAEKYGYDGLKFIHADVTKDALYDEKIDMIVTLHACDTATDYALNYAVKHGAQYIFSVPCCQHEVNLSIHKAQAEGDLNLLMDYGIIQERMSALLTDSIRAAVLKDLGYRVDLIEFIDFEHSPKNLMIRAVKTGKRSNNGCRRSRMLADKYGFRQTLLELAEAEKDQ